MDLFYNSVRLYGVAILVLIGVFWNSFNLIATVVQQWKSGGIHTVGLVICSISISNVFLHLSIFALMLSLWARVYCWQYIPLFFKAILYMCLSSSSMSFWSIAWLSVLYCVKVVSFSSVLFGKIKSNISLIINVSLVVTFLNSCVMFTPFFFLYRNESYVMPETENNTCAVGPPMFPAWVNSNLYVLIFTCYLVLLPLMVMLPTSFMLVVHLCKHTLSMRKNKSEFQSAESYLLVCRLTVSLVVVYITTLLIIAIFFFHAIFMSVLTPNLLLLGYSFYCIATGVLLTISNKSLREKFWALFSCEKASNASSKSLSGETEAG